jgi:chromosome partitioning protein
LEFPVYEMALGDDPISLWASEVRKIKADIVVIDTAPNEREMAAAIAMAEVILVPCTASGLDIEATAHTLAIIRAARRQRKQHTRVVLIPNRLDRRTLEGRQLVEELREFGEIVSPPIASRSAFVRSFSSGQSVATYAPGEPADLEIRALTDLVEKAISQGKVAR